MIKLFEIFMVYLQKNLLTTVYLRWELKTITLTLRFLEVKSRNKKV